MTPADVAALTVSLLSGLAAVISALTALITAYRTSHEVSQVGRQLNGRLDQLLQEREARIRAEEARNREAERAKALVQYATEDRPAPVVKQIPREQDDRGTVLDE